MSRKSENGQKQSLTILDKDYLEWVKQLSSRYKSYLIKASVHINSEQLKFYYSVGKDIFEKQIDNKYGTKFYATLSRDLRKLLPDAEGLTEGNLRYAKRFYQLYSDPKKLFPQVAEELYPQIFPQVAEELPKVPWGHHRLLIDKFSDNPPKALFFVGQIVENGWSRSSLMNWIDSNLYERQGKAITNFSKTLPSPTSDLAKEITKDPYSFAFAGVTKEYNEKQLKSALLSNITNFLIELGSGFAYVGKEYRLQVGKKEKFIDLLFYHLTLRCYVVIEVKMGEFDFQDVGQLGGYVVSANHILKREGDNPTIGLLICKSKDRLLAQYALESSNQPIGISDFELEKLYPAKVEGLIPTINELESGLIESPKDG